MLRSFYPAPVHDANPSPTPTPSPTPAAPWYAGKTTDDAEVGYFVRRGWDKDPVQAALEAGKAHRLAESKLGIPTNEVLRVPSKADDPGWSHVWEKLGVPKDAKGYDFSTVKNGDKALEPAQVEQLGKLAHSLNIAKDKAPQFAQEFLKSGSVDATAAEAERLVKLAEEKTRLKGDWGNNFDAHFVIAKNAAVNMGMTPVQINALENTVGYAATMQFLHKLGVKMGEDKFIRNDLKPGGGLLTKTEAQDKRRELMNDSAFRDRYVKGDRAAQKEMNDLLEVIAGVRTAQ